MVGVDPPEVRVSVAVPEPPHTRFCAPVTVPDVASIATGHTVELDGVST
ncbi:MAG: hypothetical protein ABSA93_18100 [Streptosporangiaceae bacterium]